MSNLATVTDVAAGRNPRLFTEPFREICSLALLGANAIFLFLGVTGLLLVVDRWADDFGLRSERMFNVFVGGLIPVGFPLLAMLLATHVRSVLGRARLITLVAVIEYGVSAFFGAITFLGAFANDLTSVRATLEGVLYRLTWGGLLAVAGLVTVRVWLGVFYSPKPRPVQYLDYPATYGQPYPGQPMYPTPTFAPGSAAAAYPPPQADPTSDDGSGWPIVPPPPRPAPPVIESEPTQRIPLPPPAGVEPAVVEPSWGVQPAGVEPAETPWAESPSLTPSLGTPAPAPPPPGAPSNGGPAGPTVTEPPTQQMQR